MADIKQICRRNVEIADIAEISVNNIQFPKINIVPLVKSTKELRSIWHGKTYL